MCDVLSRLTADDARDFYEAIRLAKPGGLGRVDQGDVHASEVPADLLAAMRLAAERDLVARQYAENFRQIFEFVIPALTAAVAELGSVETAIVHAQLRVMQAFPDSLIARKCGPEVAMRSAAWAGQVLNSGPPGSEPYYQLLGDFDFWLRSDGHRRNPGTTADLLAAGLFALLRDGLLRPPLFTPAGGTAFLDSDE